MTNIPDLYGLYKYYHIFINVIIFAYYEYLWVLLIFYNCVPELSVNIDLNILFMNKHLHENENYKY